MKKRLVLALLIGAGRGSGLESANPTLAELAAELRQLKSRVAELEGAGAESSMDVVRHYARTARTRLPLDVRNFGAVADDDLDDTPSIQAALDAAAKKGGTVHVPTGVFDITGLTCQSDHGAESAMGRHGVRLVGDGRSSVLRMMTAANTLGAIMYDYQGSFGGVEHLSFLGGGDCHINGCAYNVTAIHLGPGKHTTNTTQVNMNWNRFTSLYIQSVREGFVFDEGPDVPGSSAGGNWYNVFDSIHIQGVGRGLWARSSSFIGKDGVRGAGGFNDNTFIGIRIENANTGIQLQDASGNKFFGCGFENVAYGCSKVANVFPCINDPPTAIVIEASGPGRGPNRTANNAFFGCDFEANQVDLQNSNPSTTVFGSGFITHSVGAVKAMIYPPYQHDPYAAFNTSSPCCAPG